MQNAKLTLYPGWSYIRVRDALYQNWSIKILDRKNIIIDLGIFQFQYLDVEQLGDVLLDGGREPHIDVAGRRRRRARGHAPAEHNNSESAAVFVAPLSIAFSAEVGPIGDTSVGLETYIVFDYFLSVNTLETAYKVTAHKLKLLNY